MIALRPHALRWFSQNLPRAWKRCQCQYAVAASTNTKSTGSLSPTVHSMVHCPSAPPIHMRPLALHKYALYSIVLYCISSFMEVSMWESVQDIPVVVHESASRWRCHQTGEPTAPTAAHVTTPARQWQALQPAVTCWTATCSITRSNTHTHSVIYAQLQAH